MQEIHMLDVSILLMVLAIISLMGYGMRKLAQRVNYLEQNLRQITDAMSQMTGMQADSHRKLSARFGEIEERIMELSVPMHDSKLPLERRHQVLALARQGVGLEEIVTRLKAPIGEAELIMNLHKCVGGEPKSSNTNRQVKQYA